MFTTFLILSNNSRIETIDSSNPQSGLRLFAKRTQAAAWREYEMIYK